MRSLAVLSLHTSPLAQPGTGDGGGMNVYVRQLSSALARSGVTCDVFTRAWSPDQPATVSVEPGFRVHHVPAGPLAQLPKERLPGVIGEFTDGVHARLRLLADAGVEIDAIHANYWLSGVSGHVLKHDLDLPLISTFHTLDRVKAEASPEDAEPALRARAEAEVIGCSDALLASCSVEAAQLTELYHANADRIEIVAPGVDHAFFAPGDYRQARRALGFAADAPLLLFVGRIQPLKALGVAIEALGHLVHGPAGQGWYCRAGGTGSLRQATLVAVGGPSGPRGAEELARLRRLATQLDLGPRLRLVPPQGHEMLSTFYRAADVVIVPSRSESFGLVALEAAACGTPVVASAVGGLTTLVDHGRTGFLVDDRDPAVFADYVARIVGDGELAREMGVASVLRAREYTWSAAAARLRERYAELTQRQLVSCR
ncbi:MAG TPA: glycosyltransferase [Acidimicrobiales bacterium]|nr:glycosyltransferase [Acidimicrobiales bacterium]